ncbi:hypothetical protein EDC04DRAFT_2995151 [Pisolithus marmoratus]|nr:hypothetical protein EDC04DRAFT_2995151 [Pisolithus marmoratus]
MSVAQPLRISCTVFGLLFSMVLLNIDEADIELRSTKDIDFVELIFRDCRRPIRQQSKNFFREEFPQPLTVQGEAFSFSVQWHKWYSFCIPVVNNIQVNVRDVLSNSQAHKFQTVRSKLDITVGLSPNSTSADIVSPPVPNNNGLPSTTDELLNQCPRFRILVIGQSGVGKSTLINKAFGIIQASAENFEPGKADIKKELIAPQNDRFVLHDSKGFEPADGGNCEDVRSFIEERKKQEHVKDQLHAVWLCFRTPILSHGDRLLEEGAETFLKKDKSVLQNIPTIIVFTKFDRLLTHMAMQKPADINAATTEYIQRHCIDPIADVTGDTDISYVAVSSFANPGLEQGRKELINLTHRKVTEKFKFQTDTPSPVPIVTQMAQRTSPHLKVEGSIDVGRQRYWRTLTTSANFEGHTIAECLAVIHTDIVCVWNFNDPCQYLYSDVFRRQMINLAGTIDESTPASHSPARADTTSAICKESNTSSTGPPLMLFTPLTLPFEAGLGLVQWARETYQQLPNVHRKFMAYIVDLVHILDILFALTANNNEKKLTRGAISVALDTYYQSEMRRNTHQQIKSFDYKIPRRDTVLDKIISLVRMSPIDDNDISEALGKIPSEHLAQDKEWPTKSNGQKKAC